MEDDGSEVVTEQDLESFRNQWRQELKNPEQEVSREEQAKSLFLEGVSLEKKGKCFDAIKCYRRAIQLDPDIEFRAYRELSADKSNKVAERKLNENASTSSKLTDDDDLDDLIECFQRDLSTSDRLCEPSYGSDVITTALHISSLPFEIFINILKWIVSNELDLKSLENFGLVCKGFYLLARDQEIWRLACIKVWGPDIFPTTTWREMFITRPRVKFNGCYISKVTYERYGENSFQDQFYRPVQIVEYFRLLRFLPNGTLLMLTSADDLQLSVNKLKNKVGAMQSRDILKGHYKYQDSTLLIIFKKPSYNVNKFRRKGTSENSEDFTFFLELEIQDLSAKKKYTKLVWKHYSISQFRGGEESNSGFDLTCKTQFPSFYFSLVKSFHSESEDCL